MTGLEIATTIWLTIMGSCVGSFLNVVVHRLPSGGSILSPPSHCPKCKQPIRYYHNVPVLGWLVLRGRCRDCGEPISARYPMVETAVTALFVAFGWLVFATGQRDTQETLFDARLWALYVGVIVFWCALLCAALIRYDENQVPRVVWWTAATGAIVAALTMLMLR